MMVTITSMVTIPHMVTIHRTVIISRKVTIPRMITIHLVPFFSVWPQLTLFGSIWPSLALIGLVWPHRINLYKRKGLEGTPKEYLLGIDVRLREGLRAKLGLHPYQEG